MRATLYGGRPARPAVAVLGTWDPFAGTHEEFLTALCARAQEDQLAAVAIMLDPPPAIFLAAAAGYPLYDDAETRIRLVRQSGIDALVHIAFGADDLGRSAADFFDLVCAHVELAEFWLKPKQTIGSGGTGDGMAVLAECRKRRIRLRGSAPERTREIGALARHHLAVGALREAARLVGRPPTIRRPSCGPVRCAWPAGRYEAVPSDARAQEPLELDLVGGTDGMSTLSWPSASIDCLSFIAGPGDRGPCPVTFD